MKVLKTQVELEAMLHARLRAAGYPNANRPGILIVEDTAPYTWTLTGLNLGESASDIPEDVSALVADMQTKYDIQR